MLNFKATEKVEVLLFHFNLISSIKSPKINHVCDVVILELKGAGGPADLKISKSALLSSNHQSRPFWRYIATL